MHEQQIYVLPHFKEHPTHASLYKNKTWDIHTQLTATRRIVSIKIPAIRVEEQDLPV
jgi:hypothetical protein